MYKRELLIDVSNRDKSQDVTKTGKYWALTYGIWKKAMIVKLALNGGTGEIRYFGSRKRLAISNSDLLYGPVDFFCEAPSISANELIELGANGFWLGIRK